MTENDIYIVPVIRETSISLNHFFHSIIFLYSSSESEEGAAAFPVQQQQQKIDNQMLSPYIPCQ